MNNEHFFFALYPNRQTDKWQRFLILFILPSLGKNKLRTVFQNKCKTIITTRLTVSLWQQEFQEWRVCAIKLLCFVSLHVVLYAVLTLTAAVYNANSRLFCGSLANFNHRFLAERKASLTVDKRC